MDEPTQDQHPASDDQELAKVLAGVDEQVNQLPPTAPAAPAPSGLQFEETPLTGGSAPTPEPATATAGDTAATPAVTPATEPTTASEPTTPPPTIAPPTTTGNTDLDSLKKDALAELRPLVTKLDLSPDEKFDTMLLIIRSTDDQTLLAPAHEAAKMIADEKKRAEALLDIIKEIDYFGSNHAAVV